jgi:acyl-CoA synthetase (AMP-forming)/AMP-acid ligase II
MLHVLRSKATLVVPESLDPSAIAAAGAREAVTHVSVTPSHLRRMLLSVEEDALRRLPLQQITFGGEAASQSVLDKARELWPDARVTHVYAASEFGDICAASDGRAGFPRAKLERARFALAEDGELFIDGRATGDLWEPRGDRYLFSGRREEIINVGGVKVSPIEVESAALAVEGVCEARAYARSNPLLGQVVALEYSGAIDKLALRRALAQQLPKPAWPAALERVQAIALTSAGKTQRLHAMSARRGKPLNAGSEGVR